MEPLRVTSTRAQQLECWGSSQAGSVAGWGREAGYTAIGLHLCTQKTDEASGITPGRATHSHFYFYDVLVEGFHFKLHYVDQLHPCVPVISHFSTRLTNVKKTRSLSSKGRQIEHCGRTLQETITADKGPLSRNTLTANEHFLRDLKIACVISKGTGIILIFPDSTVIHV